MIKKLAFILMLAMCAASPIAAAQAAPPKADCTSLKLEFTDSCVSASELLGKLDLAVPENALFALLGATPETVIRPKVGDKLATSLLPQVVDALGNEQYALAVEVNPGLYMMPKTFTGRDLTGETDGLDRARLWSKFTLSVAASRAIGENTISQYGVGINYSHDSGSPLVSKGEYATCIRTLRRGVNIAAVALDVDSELFEGETTKHWFDDIGNVKQEFQAEFEKVYTELINQRADIEYQKVNPNGRLPTTKEATTRCARQFTRWNREMYGGGVAFYYSESDPVNSAVPPPPTTSEDGFGVWATAALPMGEFDPSLNKRTGFDPDGQFTISGRYTQNLVRERKVGNSKITETVDGWRIGARYTHSFSGETEDADAAPANAFRLFAEVAYAEEEFGTTSDEFSQAGIGVEVQVAKDIYLQAVVGDTFGSSIERSGYFTGQLKWSFSDGPAK